MAPPEEVARDYLAEITFEDAPLGKRVGAFLLDALLGTAALTPLWILFWLSFMPNLELQPPYSYAWFLLPVLFIAKMAAAVAVLSVVYFPIAEAVWGRTLGKLALGIYVTREDGRAAGWIPAILRRLPFLLEIFWIDAIFALFTRAGSGPSTWWPARWWSGSDGRGRDVGQRRWPGSVKGPGRYGARARGGTVAR